MINFNDIKNTLSPFIESIVVTNCPGGKTVGNEYKASDLAGGDGSSFSINLTTGAWADFATGQKGNDIISYYAGLKGIKNSEAASQLLEQYSGSSVQISYPAKDAKPKPKIVLPPPNAKPPKQNYRGRNPTATWCYTNENGEAMFYVSRYDYGDGKKDIIPWCFSDRGMWIAKAFGDQRPLYNLVKIHANKDKPVLIVEGEKSVDAAEKITSAYVVTTWQGGAMAVDKTDFSPLYGRKILLWPDADDAGHKAMGLIAAKLSSEALEIKYINTDMADGEDAADALLRGMDHKSFIAWAKPITHVFGTIKPDVVALQQYPEIVTDQLPYYNITEPPIEPDNTGVIPLSSLVVELGLIPVSEKNRSEPMANSANAVKLLSYIPKYAGKIWFDVFHQAVLTTYNSLKPRKWNDADDLNVLYDLQTEWKMAKVKKSTVVDAIQTIAFNNIKNELKDYLESLEWDGTDRISNFLNIVYGVELNEYTTAVSRNWLIGLVARGIQPGCKFDEMLILEGNQGTFKSTSLQLLAGKFFTEAQSNMDSKDFDQSLAGRWIVEFGELDQFRKAETTLIKKKLSQQVDSYRPPYGRNVIDIPRTCVFVGTTNKNDYLHDETGNRRFWPVWVNKTNLDYIKEYREQLFAEAVTAFKKGEPWHLMPDSTLNEQDSRREQDPWEELIQTTINGNNYILIQGVGEFVKKYPLTCSNIAYHVIKFQADRFDQRAARRIGKCMRALGYDMMQQRIDGQKAKVFHKK